VSSDEIEPVRRLHMPEVPKDPPPTPPDGIAESQEDFNKRLAEGAYGDHDWSPEDKVYLRASGLI
jgi:hypothetical protein